MVFTLGSTPLRVPLGAMTEPATRRLAYALPRFARSGYNTQVHERCRINFLHALDLPVDIQNICGLPALDLRFNRLGHLYVRFPYILNLFVTQHGLMVTVTGLQRRRTRVQLVGCRLCLYRPRVPALVSIFMGRFSGRLYVVYLSRRVISTPQAHDFLLLVSNPLEPASIWPPSVSLSPAVISRVYLVSNRRFRSLANRVSSAYLRRPHISSK